MMKKIIVAIAILVGISGVVNAQTMGKSSHSSMMKMKNGVMMVDDKAMLCSKNKCKPLTGTYKCSDGCKVSADGTVTKPDGSTMKLMNGYEIGKNGKVSMIGHGQKGHVCDANCPMHSKM